MLGKLILLHAHSFPLWIVGATIILVMCWDAPFPSLSSFQSPSSSSRRIPHIFHKLSSFHFRFRFPLDY